MLKKKFRGRIFKASKGKQEMDIFYYSANRELYKKAPKERRKNWSLVFFILNIAVTVAILIFQINSEQGLRSLGELLTTNIKLRFLIFAILCFVLSNVVSSLKLDIYHKRLQGNMRPLLCFKTNMIGKYYTKLTPMGIGGQPFQVYYFNKYGVKASNSLTMVSCSYVSNKLVYAMLALIMVCTFNYNELLMSQGNMVNIVIVLAIISFTILAIFITFVILMCVNKKLGHKLVASIIKLLTKVKIIKSPTLTYLKIMRPTLVFQRKMKQFFKSKSITLIFLVLSILEYVIEHSVLFFIYSMFNGFDINIYLQLLSISIIIELASHCIPIPGGTGVAELAFSTIFATLFGSGVLFWALITWRIITYYSYLLSGLGIAIYDYAYGKHKLRKISQKHYL